VLVSVDVDGTDGDGVVDGASTTLAPAVAGLVVGAVVEPAVLGGSADIAGVTGVDATDGTVDGAATTAAGVLVVGAGAAMTDHRGGIYTLTPNRETLGLSYIDVPWWS
jgi:hypothetical protein